MNDIRKPYASAAAALFLSLILCCSLSGPGIGLQVELPPETPSALELTGWRLLYPIESGGGDLTFKSLAVNAQRCGRGAGRQAPPRQRVSLIMARGLNLPVLAYPVYAAAEGAFESSFPAAAFYPLDVSRGILRLDWESAPAAEIIKSLITGSSGGAQHTVFDVRRLRTAMRRKSEASKDSGWSAGGNLWAVDPQPVLRRLGYGLFRESALSLLEPVCVEAAAGAKSVFGSDNPFAPAAAADAAGLLKLELVPNKKTVFAAEDGHIITAFADEEIWCIKSSRGVSESGTR